MASSKLRDTLAERLKIVKPRDENAEVVLYLDCMIRAFQVHDAEEVIRAYYEAAALNSIFRSSIFF
jgi:hypothetical protein